MTTTTPAHSPHRRRGTLILLPVLALAACGTGAAPVETAPVQAAAAGTATAETASTPSPTPSPATSPTPSPTPSPATEAFATLGSADPADFTTKIDNPYLPMVPGTSMRYEGTTAEGEEVIVVEVLNSTKRVLGVETVVVRDTVTLDGEVIEDTWDWYAQDRAGNVWYFGEDTKEYEGGKVVNTKGSWTAGVDGAEAGIVMPAKPAGGQTYKQEYYAGEAEDMADVLRTDTTASVPAGDYTDVVQTRDYTPLDPSLEEHKFYAPGVGFVLEVKTKGATERIGLVSITRPAGADPGK